VGGGFLTSGSGARLLVKLFETARGGVRLVQVKQMPVKKVETAREGTRGSASERAESSWEL